MNALRSTLRRFGAALTLATGVLLVASFWVVGTHHHDEASSHTCAVCSTAHSPAAPAHEAPKIAAAPEHHGHDPIPPVARLSQSAPGATRARAPPVTA